VSSEEQDVKSAEAFKKVPAGQLQLMPVVMAKMLLSAEPTYTVPSGPSAGDE
jgi:hypothetical protein